MQVVPPAVRDLRLDFFRGLSLWFIFVDHVPSNTVGWLTVRNFGFADAAEIFVFISGYTAAFVYGRVMIERGPVTAGARILRRAWQLYVAYVFLSVIYIAQIAYVAQRFDNPLYAEEKDLFHFLANPEIILLEVLRMRFLLGNVDILPLYIVLMVAFPAILWSMLRAPTLTLLGSAALWLFAYFTGFNFTLHPMERNWFFNPFAWQFLFVIGAWCALGGAGIVQAVVRSNVLAILCAAYLLFAFVLALTWFFPSMLDHLPDALFIFPLDKTGLSPLRLLHFLAMALITVRYIPSDAAFLRTPWAAPLILCGRHSLEVFCAGVFLSFTAHFVLVEFSSSLAMQVLVSVSGILTMIALAHLLSWYKSLDRRPQKAAA